MKKTLLGCGLFLLLGFVGCAAFLAAAQNSLDRKQQIQASPEYLQRVANLRRSLLTEYPNALKDVQLRQDDKDVLRVVVSDA